jgi:predicted nucleotidyltransferase
MENTLINRKVIKKIAHALGELNERVVYVGGAVVSLYANDPAADDVRPTKDLDISMEIASVGELEKLRQELLKKGFAQKSEDKIICRFRYDDVKVDVMATKEVGWAPANEWFKPGFDHLQEVEVDGQKIRVLPLSYYLATKFSAYHDRGNHEPRTSHDLEDIAYILDNRTDLVNEINKSQPDVKKYLAREFKQILEDDSFKEAIYGNMFYETRERRFEIIIEKLKAILNVV